MAKSVLMPTRPARKRSSKKKVDLLSICPVDDAGWCPHPFSLEQLQKRMKQRTLELEQEHQLVRTGGK